MSELMAWVPIASSIPRATGRWTRRVFIEVHWLAGVATGFVAGVVAVVIVAGLFGGQSVAQDGTRGARSRRRT